MTGKKNFQEYMAERLVALEAEKQSAISVAARAQAIIRTRKVQVVKVYLEGVRLPGLKTVEIDREQRAEKLDAWTRELGRDPHMLDTAGDDSKKTYRRVQAPPVMEETAVTLRGLVDEIDRWNLGLVDSFVEVDKIPGSTWHRTVLIFGDDVTAWQHLPPAAAQALENQRFEVFVWENWRPKDEDKGLVGGRYREVSVNLRKGREIKPNSPLEDFKRLVVSGFKLNAVPLVPDS